MKRLNLLTLILFAVLGFSSTILAQDSLNVTKLSELTLSWGPASDMAVEGNYAFVATGATGLRIMDITDPSDPVEVGYCNTPGTANGVALAGNYAVVADWFGDLRVIDISSPTHPFETGWVEIGMMCSDVTFGNGYAYALDRTSALKVVDISDPYHPAVLGECSLSGGYANGVVVSGNFAYVACYEGMQIVDVANPNSKVARIIKANRMNIIVLVNFIFQNVRPLCFLILIPLPPLVL